MGFKTKQGMWCEYCQKPVAGQKGTHRARGAAVAVTAPLTGGLSLLGAKSEAYHCPTCGQPVRKAAKLDLERHAAGIPAGAAPPDQAVELVPGTATVRVQPHPGKLKGFKAGATWSEALQLLYGPEEGRTAKAIKDFAGSLPRTFGPMPAPTARLVASKLGEVGYPVALEEAPEAVQDA
ncbi:MAG TPA: hypothetical protein VF587_15525 [Solirubrobacteraceae bacterium]|jgi:hypothetical protein